MKPENDTDSLFDEDAEGASASPRPAAAEPIDAHFEPAPSPKAQRKGPNWLSLGLASAIAALLGALIAIGANRFNSSAPAQMSRTIVRLEEQQKQAELQISALTEMQAGLGGEDLGQLLTELDLVSKRLDEALAAGGGPQAVASLQQRLAAIEAADTAGPMSTREVSRSLAGLQARVAEMDKLANGMRINRDAIEAVAVRLTQAEATLEALRQSGGPGNASGGAMPSALDSVVAGYQQSERDARLKANRAETDAEAALALTSIERAAQRGESFESDYRTLRSLKPGSSAIRQLGDVASLGAPTRAELKTAFVKAERKARRYVSDEADQGMGWLYAIFGSAVTVRSKDGGDSAGAALSGARDALQRDDLVAAVDALATLRDAPAEAMADWTQDANRRITLDRALEAARLELLNAEAENP